MTKKKTGWRWRSIIAHAHLTGPGSKARAQGLMPGYAHQAMRIALAGGRLAGMAKKRWRDAEPRRMMLREVKTLRSTINDAFDEIERNLRSGTPGHTGVRDQDAAQAAYDDVGMQGFLALALVEEAAELAEPLHAVATGRSTFERERGSIEEEQADLRIYLHVACETARIDHVAATDAKSEAFALRLPELFGPGAPKRPKVPMLTPQQTMSIYAELANLPRPAKAAAADEEKKEGE